MVPRLVVPGPPLVPAGLPAGGGEHLYLVSAFSQGHVVGGSPDCGHCVQCASPGSACRPGVGAADMTTSSNMVSGATVKRVCLNKQKWIPNMMSNPGFKIGILE